MYSCNRYNAQRKAGEILTNRRQVVLKDCKDWEEMSKFLHYYERYKEHIKSYEVSCLGDNFFNINFVPCV